MTTSGLKVCPGCGCSFYVGTQGWGYAYDGKPCCSYSCMRTLWRIDMLTDEQKSKLNELYDAGKTNAEIAAELNMGVKTVSNYFNGVHIRKKRAEAAGEGPAQMAAPESQGEAPSGPAPVTEQERIIALGVIREALETIKALYGLK